LAVLALAAYANTLGGPLVFDGKDFIANHTRIRKIWPPWAPMLGTTRPVVVFTFAVNYALHGMDTWGYRAANLTIHLMAGWVLFDLVRRTLMLERPGGRYGHAASGLALAVAAIWLVHPLQTQSVTYVYQRFESLMGLFFLLSLYCLLRGDGAQRSGLWYMGSLVSCLLAMGSKEVAATLPLVLVWYDRAFLSHSWRELLHRRWKLYAPLGGLLVLAAFWIASSLDIYRGGQVLYVEGVSPLDYALTQPAVILHYLRLSFWPQGQCIDYAWPVADSPAEILIPAAILLAILAGTIWCIFRRPAWGFVLGSFFLILAPTSSVFPIRDLAFEHRMYLPLASVVVVATLGAYELLRRQVATKLPASTKPGLYATAALIVVVSLTATTFARNRVYRSELAFWSDVVAKAPHNPRGHNSLGAVLTDIGETDAAVGHFRRALELDSDYPLAHYNLGTALVNSHPKAAVHHLRQVLEAKPRHLKARCNLGTALANVGDTEGAVRELRKVLEAWPDMAKANNNLGNLLSRQSPAEAIRHFRVALRTNPSYPDAHNNLAVVLERQGRLNEAVEHYRRAIELKPQFAGAHCNIARVLSGRHPDLAAKHYMTALRLRPRLAQAHNGLGSILARAGRLDEAIRHYQAALQIRPDYSRARENLDRVQRMR
jgi:Flp pilus assembly protein TadD